MTEETNKAFDKGTDELKARARVLRCPTGECTQGDPCKSGDCFKACLEETSDRGNSVAQDRRQAAHEELMSGRNQVNQSRACFGNSAKFHRAITEHGLVHHPEYRKYLKVAQPIQEQDSKTTETATDGILKGIGQPESAFTGLEKDAEIEVTAGGGKHSKIHAAFHLLPAQAVARIAATLDEGYDKYEGNYMPDSLAANWRKISRQEHLNHVLNHLFAYLAGDRKDDHLGHAATRMLFALETKPSDGPRSPSERTPLSKW